MQKTKVKARVHRSPLAFTLLNSAVSFAQEAVTLQNAPNVANRHEKVAINLLTAWEKLLKAYLYKFDKKRGIYYKSLPLALNQCVPACPYYTAKAAEALKKGQSKALPKSISFDECLNRLVELVGGDFAHPRETLLLTSGYRDTCVHTAVEELDAIQLPLLTNCVLDFVAFLRQHFQRELFAEMNLAILPVGYSKPFTAADFLTTYNATSKASPQVSAFLQSITEAGQRLHAAGHTEGLLVEYHLHLINVRNPAKADTTVRVDNTDSTAPKIRIDRLLDGEVSVTDSPNASKIRMPDDADTLMQLGFTLDYGSLKGLVLLKGYVLNLATKQCIADFKKDLNLAKERQLKPGNSKSSSTWFYHISTQTKLMEFLCTQGKKRAPGVPSPSLSVVNQNA